MSPGPVDSRRGGCAVLPRCRLEEELHAVMPFRRFTPVDSRRCGSLRSLLPGACALPFACPPLRELARPRTPGCGVACAASCARDAATRLHRLGVFPHVGRPTGLHAQEYRDRSCSRRRCHTSRPASNARSDRQKCENRQMWVRCYQPQRVGPKVWRRRAGLVVLQGPPDGLRRPSEAGDSVRSGRNNASNAHFNARNAHSQRSPEGTRGRVLHARHGQMLLIAVSSGLRAAAR